MDNLREDVKQPEQSSIAPDSLEEWEADQRLVDKIEDARRQFASAYLTPSSSSSSSMSARRRGRKGKETITSKTFNIVAGRPLSQPKIRMNQIVVEMREKLEGYHITSISVPTFAAVAFTLAGFAQYAAYTTVFDQYKFDQIEVWIEPSGIGGVTNAGTLTTCVDLDDAGTPTTIASVEAHQSALDSTGLAGHYHKWVPHVAVAVYSGTFTSYGNSEAQWIDVASPNVQHYGIKSANSQTSVLVAYNMSVRARVSFRQPGI